MNNRPTSITVISWILIVMGGLSVISSALTINNPMVREMMSKSPVSLTIQYAMLVIGLAVTLTSGVCMLHGKAWARQLYVGWGAIGFLISFNTSPMKAAIIPGFVVYLVISFFLFRPKANAFFSPTTSPNGSQSI